jgi:hypothetical protein
MPAFGLKHSKEIEMGTLEQRYAIYLACADDGTGHSITDGKPLKTFEEWLNS